MTEKRDNATMTDKQKRFVEEYLIDLNATKAAIRAGYSKESARQIGADNMSKTYIQEAIAEAMKRRSERTEVTQDMIVAQLAKIAFVDMKDVVTWEEREEVVGVDKEGNVHKKNRLRISVKESDEVDGTVLQEISETVGKAGVTHSIKLNDRMKALEMLGRHLGMFKDKVEHSGTVVNKNIDVSYMTDEQLEAELKKYEQE